MKHEQEEMSGLFGQFSRVLWLFHRYHQRNHHAHGPMGDPHRGQGRILSLLKMKPEISQKDLSYLLDMRPQSLGELLTKLERSNFITRTASETDRRVMEIRLTEEGMKAANHGQPHTGFAELFDCLSQEEQNSMSGYLTRIAAELETKLGIGPGSGIDWREDRHFHCHDREGRPHRHHDGHCCEGGPRHHHHPDRKEPGQE